MGLWDNVDQYFSNPDVSSGYSGMDSGGGAAWDDFGNDFNYDVAVGNYDSSSFWDDTPDAWDASYDDVFSSDVLMPDDWDSFLLDPQDQSGDESWGDKALSFLGSKNGLALLSGALTNGLKMYSQDKKANVLAKQKEEDRKFEREMQARKEAHDKEMLAMRLAAQEGGGGPQELPPGTVKPTTTTIGAHKVRW